MYDELFFCTFFFRGVDHKEGGGFYIWNEKFFSTFLIQLKVDVLLIFGIPHFSIVIPRF